MITLINILKILFFASVLWSLFLQILVFLDIRQEQKTNKKGSKKIK